MFKKYIHRILIMLFLGLSPMLLQAQNEVDRERSSLKGIQSMGFSVNYEAPSSLMEAKEIDISSLQKMGEQMLSENNITVISEKKLKESDQFPLLYVHINAMNAGRGLIPFAINVYFYQPVKLSLNRDLQTTANTWETATLGLVSHDQLDVINESAEGLINEFINDYKMVNN